jgi:hypothetical protein
MKKTFYIICFYLVLCFDVTAQTNADTIQPFEFIPGTTAKPVIHLKNDRIITETISKITSSLVVLSIPLQGFTNSNSSTSINIAEIQAK